MTTSQISVDITGMTCAACAGRVKRVLEKSPEFSAVNVDLAQDRAILTLADTVSEPAGTAAALEGIRNAGYIGYPRGGTASERAHNRQLRDSIRHSEYRWLMARAGLALAVFIPFLIAMIIEIRTGAGHVIAPEIQLALAMVVQIIAAWPFYKGVRAAIRTRSANMDVLVVLGTLAGFLLSLKHVLDGSAHHGAALYFEGSVAVIAFVLLGKLIEKVARREAGAALSALSTLLPEEVSIREGSIERLIPREALVPGMLVLVKAGQILSVDGIIREGRAFSDESSMTGESLPVTRAPGDHVRAGSAIRGGYLVIEASATGEHTHLARLARLIEDAGSIGAPSLTLVDRISAIFVPAVIGLASLTFIGWWLHGAGIEAALIIAASVLVVACPCALGLATPVALVAGASSGARQGLILTDHAGLEAGTAITHAVFDKTGTLTQGRPEVTDIAVNGISNDEAIALACRLAAHSDHPLDSAIVAAARERGVFRDEITAFASLAGAGLSGEHDGHLLHLGALAHAASGSLNHEAGSMLAARLPTEAQAQPMAFLSKDGVIIAVFAFGDLPRPGIKAAIAKLLDLGIEPMILSGDRQEVVSPLAARLGITNARGGLKPEDKLHILQKLRESGAKTAFIGDGLNDGPALRAADVGIAMGSGAEVARGAASVILARPDIGLVPSFIALAHRTRRTIRENLTLAFIFNGIAIPMAMAGKLSPGIAGAAMALSSLAVVANAFRLARWRAS